MRGGWYGPRRRRAVRGALLLAALSGVLVLAACGSGAQGGAGGKGATNGKGGKIVAVGAENEYANVISQIGGKYVSASAIMSNPNTDPHTFEASPQVGRTVSAAQLVIQNGVGYDSFMDKIEAASPSKTRKVIDVQKLLGLPATTPNPHLWYSPRTMPAVAQAVATDLSALDPAHTAYFKANAKKFDLSLQPWLLAIAAVKARYPHVPVATTEPVADYMLQAAGANIMTPFALQADIMNGVDPSPQAVSLQESFFSQHKVKVFLYNQQVTDTITQTFLTAAKNAGIPIVGVYETMPTPGYTYQSWMLAEVHALQQALAHKKSTTTLGG